MLYKYHFRYKVRSIPYYYTFSCYADSEKEAEALFMLRVGVYDVVSHYLSHVEPCEGGTPWKS